MKQHAIFRAGDVLGMAVELERQGLSFYQTCLKVAGLDPDIKQVFEFLADQERLHMETFNQMKTRVPDHRLPESYPGEMRSYLDGFVRKRFFYEHETARNDAAGMQNPFETIAFAVEFEKRSISFYENIKATVRASEIGIIDEIIEQERNHIRRLTELKQELERR